MMHENNIAGTEKTFYIPVGTKKYPLIITETTESDPEYGPVVHVYCEVIRLDQQYMKCDLPLLLEDIGGMIEDELTTNQTAQIHIRIKPVEKILIEQNAEKYGYKNTSDFLKTIGAYPERILQTR